MSIHRADLDWRLADGDAFETGRYSRGHILRFDGGTEVPASASPHVVGAWALEAAVDPEEMLTAALSSCHMLTFLHVARLAGYVITAYRDRAEGIMAEIAPGRRAVTRVTLHPEITWAGATPGADALADLHHRAHEECFIANSVTTEIVVA